MKSGRCSLSMILAISMSCSLAAAQQSATTQSSAPVPRLVNFAGKAADVQGKPIAGIAGVTLAIYKDQYEGAPLWLETQNIQADAKGNYTVQLGATKPAGLPLDLFSSGDARWLGVTVNGGQEQPRVLLLSVPYALKAADAETIGGLPPSAFVLAAPPVSTSMAGATSQGATVQPLVTGTNPVTTAGGTPNLLPKFDATADITNSQIFDNGTNVGISNTAPAAKLDVSGTGIFRGLLSLPATGTAAATAGKNSQPFNFTASSFNSGTAGAVNQVFRWQAEPAGNNTTTPSGTLNLLYGSGTAVPTETGLHINNKGVITFASAQTFPAAGTVSSVGLSAPSSDFTVTGSPVTKSGTLNLNWNVAPTSANMANAIVKRDASGSFSAASESVGGSLNAGSIVTGPISAGAINATGPVSGFVGGSLGSGVYGQAIDISLTGRNANGFQPVGAWGDSGALAGFGVLGTEDNGFAVVGLNSSGHPTAYFQNNSGGAGDLLFDAISSVFGGFCTIDVRGNLFCTGSKSAVVSVDGGSRRVALYAIEGSENWFEDAGTSRLLNGEAMVNLESVFGQTVNTDMNYHVFLTPNGDCKGLYVTQKTARSFVVRELAGGKSSIGFDYRIMAKRKGYENIRLADKTEAFSLKNLLVRHPAGASHKMPNPQDIQKQMLERATARPVAQVSKAR